MELLQLGLSLSSNNNNVDSAKGFDPNFYLFVPYTEISGSDSVSQLGSCSSSTESTSESSKKRGLSEAFETSEPAVTRTLPLLLWNKYPIEEEDDGAGHGHGRELDKNSSTITTKSDGDEDGVVGWPPVNSWRKKICRQNRSGEHVAAGDFHGGGGGAKSTYVKVKMEGVAIARKVDLSAHHSYETLTDKLAGMFGGGKVNFKDYTLLYQDKEGDWLLAGDVPWSSFIQSVQRLKLVKEQQ